MAYAIFRSPMSFFEVGDALAWFAQVQTCMRLGANAADKTNPLGRILNRFSRYVCVPMVFPCCLFAVCSAPQHDPRLGHSIVLA